MALTPVDMIIKELCKKTGEPEFRNYDDFIGPIRRGFSQLNIAAIQVVKYVYIPLNNYNALEWPCDCIQPIATGVTRNGRTAMLSIDDKIIPEGTYSSSSTITDCEKEIDSILSGEYVPDYLFEINENGELFGLGPGFNQAGYVTHTKSTRQSHIKGRFNDDDNFLLVYLSDGISDGLDYVPVETEPALIDYCLYEYYQIRNPGLSGQMWQKFEMKDVPFLRKLYTAETVDSWAEAFQHNEKSSPK